MKPIALKELNCNETKPRTRHPVFGLSTGLTPRQKLDKSTDLRDLFDMLVLLLALANAAPLEIQKPAARFENRFSFFPTLLSGYPLITETLQGEATFGLTDEATWTLKLVPVGRVKIPNAIGGAATAFTAEGDLREGWIEFAKPDWEFRLGNQIISFGAADRINPTDVWNSVDNYDFFVADKVPELTARVRIHPQSVQGVELELLGTPFFKESRYPVTFPSSGTRALALTSSRWLLPLPNFVSVAGTPSPLYYELASPSYPVTWQGAARLKFTGWGNWDFSVIGFDGVEKDPRVAFTAQGTAGSPTLPLTLTLNPSYHRMRLLGADAAGGFTLFDTPFGVRFEGAYVVPDNSRVSLLSAAQQAELIRDRYVHVVAGIDHTLERNVLGTVVYWNLMGVYFERIDRDQIGTGTTTSVNGMPDFTPWDRNVVFYLEDRIGSTWTLSASTIWSIQNGDVMVAPEIRWNMSDAVKTSLGGHFFIGNRSGFFGQFYDAQRILWKLEVLL